uniref:Uncharacterized protein n=1 Tax=viral metagenome TaxID=1070528 RepID=A0A6C0B8Q1_9ZZZZ
MHNPLVLILLCFQIVGGSLKPFTFGKYLNIARQHAVIHVNYKMIDIETCLNKSTFINNKENNDNSSFAFITWPRPPISPMDLCFALMQ